MARKRWSPQMEITPALLKFREKRKWQIALRRYVLDKNNCIFYAPYFGLDIERLRNWIEIQFEDGVEWSDFGKKWQFDHIIPVTYFDFSIEEELKMCWNFTNIRVEQLNENKDRGNRLDLLAAKGYFEEMYRKTSYIPCLRLLEKISKIESAESINSDRQQQFIIEHSPYLEMIENYLAYEFELLNSGRGIDAVKKEIEFFKKLDK